VNDNEAKLCADLDAAIAAIKESNRLLMQSILKRDSGAIEQRVIKLRASRWKLALAVREFHRLADGTVNGP
jgi:hypothetical protein